MSAELLDKLDELEIRKDQWFRIGQFENHNGKGTKTEWRIERMEATEEEAYFGDLTAGPVSSIRSNLNMSVPPQQQNGAKPPQEQGKASSSRCLLCRPTAPAPANGTANHPSDPVRSKTKLEDALKTVVAACHAANQYAKEIGFQMPPFTSEDLRTMANTLIIDTQKQNSNGYYNGGGR